MQNAKLRKSKICNRSTDCSRLSLKSTIYSASGESAEVDNSRRAGFTPLDSKHLTGFTLLELIIVMFILSLLAAIVAPRFMGESDKARVTEAKVQIRNFETALKLFKLDNGFYPDTQQGLDALVEAPAIGRIPQNYKEGGYLEKRGIPLDPWGNPYLYISPGLQGDFDIISYGADNSEAGEGFDADIKNWDLQ